MFYINYLIVFFNHLHIKNCVIYLKCDKIFHIYYNITTLSYLFSFGTYFQSSIFYFNPFYICVMEDYFFTPLYDNNSCRYLLIDRLGCL